MVWGIMYWKILRDKIYDKYPCTILAKVVSRRCLWLSQNAVFSSGPLILGREQIS